MNTTDPKPTERAPEPKRPTPAERAPNGLAYTPADAPSGQRDYPTLGYE